MVVNREGAVDDGLLGVDFFLADSDVVLIVALCQIIILGDNIVTVSDILCNAVVNIVATLRCSLSAF